MSAGYSSNNNYYYYYYTVSQKNAQTERQKVDKRANLHKN